MKLTETGAEAIRDTLAAMEADGSLAAADIPILLNRAISAGHEVRVQYITGQWLDIDDALDLARAGELV